MPESPYRAEENKAMSKRTNRKNSKDLIGVALLLPLGAALTATPGLQAQPVSFTNIRSTIPASGLYFPTSVAVNGAGDVFIADELNNRVVKVSSTGVQTTVADGLWNPQGVGLDGAGNLFIADTYNNRVLKLSTAGALSTVVSGLKRPMGVAVDRAGNLIIADAYNDRVLKVATNGTQTIVGGGLRSPSAVAVDGAGNIFIADTDNNRVLKVAPDGTQSLVTRQVWLPFGVAVDGAGNVFIADTNDFRVIKVSPDGTMTDVDTALHYPYGVAVDQAGSIFIADSDNNRVLELQFSGANFGARNVCPSGQSSPATCSRTLNLNYQISETVDLGAPAVLTLGVPNLDFKLAGSNCTGVLTGGATCSVNVTFAPQAPGVRLGGVEITDSSGKVLTATSAYGQGLGAAVAYGPGTQTTVAGRLSSPAGVAVDGAGNVYIADFASQRVLKVTPGGAPTEVGSGLRFPAGVAVNGAGDVFIAETGNNRVVKVRARDGAQTTVADGLSLPQGVAVDGAGNVYVADYGNNRVLKIPAAGGAATTVGIALSLPYAVAVDGAGNVYVADYGHNLVQKVAPNGAQSPVPIGGLNHPTSVAVDAAGTVFIGDTENNRVLAVPVGAPPITLGTELSHPQGVAIDAVGNIFIADSSNNRVVEVQRSGPPAFNFTPTLVGKTNGPQTVTIRNIGNQRLNAVAPGLTIGAGFQQGPGVNAPPCNPHLVLPPGLGCDLSINFVPQTGGNFQTTAVLTDNALNAAAATQTVNLSGTGVFPTTTSAQAASGQYSDPVTLTAVIGPPGLSFAGTLQFNVAGAAACSVAVTGSGTYSCSYAIAQPAPSATIHAILASSDPTVQGSNGFNTLTITAENATIVPSPLNPTSVQANPNGEAPPFSLTAHVLQAADGSLGDLSKPLSFSVKLVATGKTPITCAAGVTNGVLMAVCRLVPVGTYTVQWSTTGSYFQAPTVNTALTVTP
jgi:sugar lactone lactonase YvrE